MPKIHLFDRIVEERLNVHMHKTVARHLHPQCCVCGGSESGLGLALDFREEPDGSIQAVTDCPPEWEGYPGWVHGGISAALLDGAMTHCLFAQGIAGVTADLHIRYTFPVELGLRANVSSRCLRRTSRYYRLKAQIRQRGRCCAEATAIFMNLPDQEGSGDASS